jgi:zinc protease
MRVLLSMKNLFLLLLLLSAPSSRLPALAAQYPTSPPAPLPLTPAPFPPFQEETLPNGVRVLVVRNSKQPIVSLSLSFPAGGVWEPAGKEGLADMVAGLLTKGAGTRSAEEIADAIEGVGGSLTAGAGSDFLSINATVLAPSLPLAFELLGDVAARPSFPEKEVELLRTQTLSGLQVELSQPASLAQRALFRNLYGDHPYGSATTPGSVRAITRADIVAFHRARVRPGGALLVLAGDVTLEQARQLATRAFRGWTGAAPTTPLPTASGTRSQNELVLVHRAGSVQSNILIGNLTFAPNDPRWYAATVANKVLGGGADSRLFMILREQKSWTYGAYSDLVRRRGTGAFVASAEVRTEVTDSALAEMLTQLRRIGTEPVPAEEFEAARGALVGSYPLSIETAEQVAGAVATARLYGLGPDYVQTYRVRLGAVSPAEAQAAARTVIRPDQAVIVVVGDGQKIYDRIKDVAPVRIVDPEGTPLSVEDLNPKAAALDLDLAALVPRRDSFAINAQGAELGWLRGVLERTDSGFRYVEDTRIANFVNQTTTLELDPRAGMRSVKQSGTVQGIQASIDVRFNGTRATGTASVPGPDGVKSVTIDTTLAPGTIDDNAIQALLPAFPWKPDAKWTFAVLSSGQGEIRTVTLAVTGTESVTVGGQTVECYRAEVSGLQSPVTFLVSTATPHRLMKILVAGTPIEMIRASP